MSNPTCQKFERVLWAFLDGDMSERERIVWEQHIASCNRCRDVRDEARTLVLTYQNLPEYDSPEAVLRDLLERDQMPNPFKRFWRNIQHNLPGQRVYRATLATAALLVGGLLIFTAVKHRRST